MIPFTINQWVVLVLAFILGLVLGLLFMAGGKWKRRCRELETERDQWKARAEAARDRIHDLESGAPVTAGTAGAIGAAARGKRDDLSLIRGVGPEGETKLNELGIYSYRDIETLDDRQLAELEGGWGAEPGFVDREHWREQARLLREGKIEEQRKLYPPR